MNCRSKYLPVFFTIIVSTNSIRSFSQDQKEQSNFYKDSVSVVETINNFVDAFTNLDWQKFTEFFSDDATAFFPPSAKFPFRANNKMEIESVFKKVFENARKQKAIPHIL